MSNPLDLGLGKLIILYNLRITELECELAEMTALKEMWQDEALLHPARPESTVFDGMVAEHERCERAQQTLKVLEAKQ